MNNATMNSFVHIFLNTLGVFMWATDPDVELPGKVIVVFKRTLSNG